MANYEIGRHLNGQTAGSPPTQTPDGAKLRNIRERVQALISTLRLSSTRGRGTVPTISLPCPTAADGRR